MDKHRRDHPVLLALQGVDLLCSVVAPALVRLIADTDMVDLPAARTIAQTGRHARQFIAVVDGWVEQTDERGRATQIGPGGQVGARELVDVKPFAATFTTLTSTTVLVMSAPAFRWAADEFSCSGLRGRRCGLR